MYRRFYSFAPIVLRNYQKEAIDKVLQRLDQGVRRPAVVLATGGGKSVVMSYLIPKIRGFNPKRKKTLVLAHKEELVRQIAQTLRRVNPDLEVDIDMRNQRPSSFVDVVVGSVPTLVRLTRLEKYDPAEYKAIVVDECHHATASSWKKILDYFGALNPELELAVVGFTATLERADGVSLGNVFQEVAYERSLITMIEQKELCDAQFLSIRLDIDLSQVGTHAGDYEQTELDSHVNTPEVNQQLARSFKKVKLKLGLKSTLVFCVSIEHCKTLSGVLQAQGINAQYVTGDTVRHERRAILEDFKTGKIAVLCNVLVFTEGTDIPNIDSLILGRPTKSRPLLTQMIGRGLRLHKGKELCHIIDMVDATSVGILSVPILFGLPPDHKIDRKSFKDLVEDKKVHDSDAELIAAQERENNIRNLLISTEREKDWDIKLEKRGDFADLLKFQLRESRVTQKQRKLFLKDFNGWVCLEYNVWGTTSSNEFQYWIIEMNDESELEDCTLYKLRVASQRQILASHFKCTRKNKQLINSGKLPYLLGIVGQNTPPGSKFWYSRRPATEKQQAAIYKKYRAKVKALFGEESLDNFREKLKSVDQKRINDLLLAADYSMSCWYVYKTLKQMMEV